MSLWRGRAEKDPMSGTIDGDEARAGDGGGGGHGIGDGDVFIAVAVDDEGGRGDFVEGELRQVHVIRDVIAGADLAGAEGIP